MVFTAACNKPPSKQNRLDIDSIVQISSSAAALHIGWLFIVDTEGTQVLFRIWGKKRATGTHKMVRTLYGSEYLSHIHVFEWFKYSERNMRTLKLIQRVDSHHLLKIQKELLKFRYWWSETSK